MGFGDTPHSTRFHGRLGVTRQLPERICRALVGLSRVPPIVIDGLKWVFNLTLLWHAKADAQSSLACPRGVMGADLRQENTVRRGLSYCRVRPVPLSISFVGAQ